MKKIVCAIFSMLMILGVGNIVMADSAPEPPGGYIIRENKANITEKADLLGSDFALFGGGLYFNPSSVKVVKHTPEETVISVEAASYSKSHRSVGVLSVEYYFHTKAKVLESNILKATEYYGPVATTVGEPSEAVASMINQPMLVYPEDIGAMFASYLYYQKFHENWIGTPWDWTYDAKLQQYFQAKDALDAEAEKSGMIPKLEAKYKAIQAQYLDNNEDMTQRMHELAERGIREVKVIVDSRRNS